MKRKSLAIPIRVTDFSDSSQIVTLFTRETGVLDGIAKGAYRPKSAFQAPFDLAVLREVVWVERRLGLAILTDSEVISGYRGLRASWERHVAASHVIELLRAVASGGEPAHELFDLSGSVLGWVSEAPAESLGQALVHFEIRSLRVLGFLGEIGACVSCDRGWPGRTRGAFFSPARGGLLCRDCRASMEPREPAAALPGEAVEVVRALAETSRVQDVRLARPLLAELHHLLVRSTTECLERPFRMRDYASAWI